MFLPTYLIAAVSVFGASVVANTPASSSCRAGSCNADNCLRAVRASSQAASRSLDCSAYLTKTVTPCPTTITNTFTQTSTLPAVTVLATSLQTSFSTVVNIETDLSTKLFTTVQTSTIETDSIQATSVVSQLTTQFAVVTTIVTLPGVITTVFQKKRALESGAIRIPDVLHHVAERAASSSQCPFTKSQPALPAYASACSGAVRYSSACSCVGVTATTITLPQSTVTVNATSTAQKMLPTSVLTTTSELLSVVTQSSTTIQETDVTQTSVIDATLITTYTTILQTTVSTVLATSVVTSSVPPLQTCAFKLLVSGGPKAGQFLQNQGQNGFAIFASSGTTYRLDTSGQVTSGDQIWNVDFSTYSFIDVDSDASIRSGGYGRLYCHIDGTTLAFTCRSSNGFNTLYSTNDAFSDFPEISTSVPSGSSALNLVAVPQC